MSIIVVGHEKGGTGKSSVAVSLAARIVGDGMKAVVLDTDQTATSIGWHAIRDHNKVQPLVPVLQQAQTPAPLVVELAARYEAVIVDVGARDYSKLRDLARICDLWIAPTTVGQGDLGSTIRLYEGVSGFHGLHKSGHIPFWVLFNRVSTQNAVEEVDARDFLESEAPGIKILKSVLKERKPWRDAGRLGLGISEMPGRECQRAVSEFDDFYNEALGVLKTRKGGK